MVERTEAQTWSEFKGEVVEVALEQPKEEDRLPQFHIQIKPLDKEIKGKTGLMHEWVRTPATSTETSVPRGSVIDRYIEALEDVHGDDAKECKTVKEIFELMKGNTYLFKSKVLGRAFGNNQAAEYWVPVKLEK
jgi:hypothetical protein